MGGTEVIESISFFVPGHPQPAGSKRAFVLRGGKHAGRAIITDANSKAKDWKSDVRGEAQRSYQGELLECALRMKIIFTIYRPKGHYRTGANAHKLKDSANPFPISKPDVDKLSRAILDSLTGIIYRDDSQVVTKTASKRYGGREGALIEVSEEVTV